MKSLKPKMNMQDRLEIASKIAELGIGLAKISTEQDICKKLGTNLITVAAAFINPFHAEEIYEILVAFNRRKLNEELAKRN